MRHNHAARVTGICSILAGLLHLSIVAIVHWTPFPPLEGVFFIVGGLAQCIIGFQFLRKPTIVTHRAGISLNGGIAMLYILMQFLPVPFVGEPENVELLGVIILVLEIIAVGTALRWLLTHAEHGKEVRIHAALSGTLSIALLWGTGYYGGAQSMALLMPDRVVEHNHSDEDSHPSMLPEEHKKMLEDMNNHHEDKEEGHGH